MGDRPSITEGAVDWIFTTFRAKKLADLPMLYQL